MSTRSILFLILPIFFSFSSNASLNWHPLISRHLIGEKICKICGDLFGVSYKNFKNKLKKETRNILESEGIPDIDWEKSDLINWMALLYKFSSNSNSIQGFLKSLRDDCALGECFKYMLEAIICSSLLVEIYRHEDCEHKISTLMDPFVQYFIETKKILPFCWHVLYLMNKDYKSVKYNNKSRAELFSNIMRGLMYSLERIEEHFEKIRNGRFSKSVRHFPYARRQNQKNHDVEIYFNYDDPPSEILGSSECNIQKSSLSPGPFFS